jgi:23S rRNA pseudouridine1911/1915/1917 synthase
MNGPRVIAEAGGVVAVWKPAGLATQAPPGIASAEAWLRRRLHGERGGGNRGGGYLGVPHRLDRGVSGVVLFAATPRAARQLSRQFERRQVRKRYLAIVARDPAGHDALAALEAAAAGGAGAPSGAPDTGAVRSLAVEPADGGVAWCDALEKIADEARARIVAAGASGGREAVSIARLVGELPGGRLLLDLWPVTGRMHQLRLQAAARGLPVLGDDIYGLRGDLDRDWSARVEAVRSGAEGAGGASGAVRPATLALHAARIEYTDPDGGGAMAVDADLPDYWPPQAFLATPTQRP